MGRLEQYVVNREKEKVPISVGTAMAIMALDGNKRYDSIWINVRTLFRNILGALGDTEIRNIFYKKENLAEGAEAIAAAISQETEIIRNYLNGKVGTVVLYLLGYEDLKRIYPLAKLKVPSTDLQKGYINLMEKVMDIVLSNDYDQMIFWDKGSELQGDSGRSVIITSYPVDLLSRTKFRELRLLESHTGAIKPKSQWYTKLTDGKTLSNIPFNRFTIQLFGDGNLQFERYGIKFRAAILELAYESKWTPVTTLDRIRFTLNRMRDKFSGEMLKKLL